MAGVSGTYPEDIEALIALIQEKDKRIKEKEEKIEVLTYENKNLKQLLFGSKSEKYKPDKEDLKQAQLFNEAEVHADEDSRKVKVKSHSRNRKKKNALQALRQGILQKRRRGFTPSINTDGLTVKRTEIYKRRKH